MMKLYFTFTKRNLAVILAVIIIAFILLAQFFSVGSGKIDGSTNAKRTEYLSRLGLEVDQTAASVEKIIIPENFNKIYQKYNNLQLKSGFDLENYKGESAELYTYSLDSERVVHLIICNDKIIGGDIENLTAQGEMTALE